MRKNTRIVLKAENRRNREEREKGNTQGAVRNGPHDSRIFCRDLQERRGTGDDGGGDRRESPWRRRRGEMGIERMFQPILETKTLREGSPPRHQSITNHLILKPARSSGGNNPGGRKKKKGVGGCTHDIL